MKYNFSKKRKVQVYMLLTTMLLCVSACAFSSFDTYADGNINLIDFYDMDSSIFDYSNVEGFTESSRISNNQNYYDYLYENNLLQVSSSDYTTSDYPHYFFYESVDNKKSNFIPCPEDAFVFINSSGFSLWINNSYYTDGFFHYAEFYGSSYSTPGFQGWGRKYSGSSSSYNGTGYNVMQILFQQYDWSSLLKTDLPVYYSDNLKNASGADFSEDLNPQINNEEILEHMTLRDDTTKFYISNTTFNNGNVYIYAGTDEYQMSSENIANYSLRITGSCSTNLKFNRNGAQLVTYNGKNIRNYFPLSEGSSNQYNFTLNSNNGSYIDIPFASLSNNSYTFSLAQLNGHFTGASGSDNSYQLMAKAFDSSYSSIGAWKPILNAIGGTSILGYRLDLSSHLDDYEVEPLGIVDHLELYVYNSQTKELSSVQSTIDFNFVTGTQTADNIGTSSDDNVMQATGSQYVPSDYVSTNTNSNYGGSMQNGGSSSSSSSPSVSPSISGGDNSINIVNNNTNNGGSNGGSGSSSTNESSLLSDFSITTLLIKYIAGGKNSGVSYIEDLAGTNTYLSIVTNYMSFVPSEIWSLVITTFSVCLGCVIVAFIISIVIKIIT